MARERDSEGSILKYRVAEILVEIEAALCLSVCSRHERSNE